MGTTDVAIFKRYHATNTRTRHLCSELSARVAMHNLFTAGVFYRQWTIRQAQMHIRPGGNMEPGIWHLGEMHSTETGHQRTLSPYMTSHPPHHISTSRHVFLIFSSLRGKARVCLAFSFGERVKSQESRIREMGWQQTWRFLLPFSSVVLSWFPLDIQAFTSHETYREQIYIVSRWLAERAWHGVVWVDSKISFLLAKLQRKGMANVTT